MLNSWDMYWLTRLDVISLILCIIFFLSLAIWGIAFAVSWLGEEEFPKWSLKPAIIIIIVGIITALVPNTKTMVAILFVPKIINNEYVQQIPENAAKFIDAKIKSGC